MLLHQEKQVFDNIEKLSEVSVMVSDTLKIQSASIDKLSKAIIALNSRIVELEQKVETLKSYIPI